VPLGLSGQWIVHDVSFSDDDAQPLISYCPALTTCWPFASFAASAVVLWRPFGLRAMSIVRCFRFSVAVVVALTASLVLTAAPAFAQVKWNLPSAYPPDNFHSRNLEAFAKDVAQATDGKLAIMIYPNASLFPASAIKSAVRVGQVQIGETLISLHENEDAIFGIDVVPFLATTYDEARKLWAASKPAIARNLAAQGLMVLFAVPWPPQGIFANQEINQLGDLKGLSWRVYNAGTRRIAQIVEAYPVTIQAADLRQALATGLINALMTSAATGYDVNVWDRMGYFYDTRAWIPKNVTLVNKTAFDRLDKPIQDSMLKVAAAAEARGWWWSQDKTKWYTEQLAAHGMKVLPASVALKTGLQEIGERLTAEWRMRAGADGQAIIEAYRRLTM
jgi:TRAP-type C4-dicarboxylate transport system substrate-binding protein